MRINPEFQRQLWLELSAHRLIAAPLVAFVVFLLAQGLAEPAGEKITAVGALLVFAIAALWGQGKMVDAVFSEVREGTWDTQKLSALSPWALTWGKLLGATAFQWYLSLICVLVFFVGTGARGRSDALLVVTLAGLGALLGHAIAFMAALIAVRRGVRGLSGALLTFLITGAMLLFARYWSAGELAWFGWPPPKTAFAIASLAAFSGWAVVGAWRMMCVELRVHTLPWAWLGFIAFAAVYVAGFVAADEHYATPSISALAALLEAGVASAAVLTYLAAFLEPKDAISVRKLIRSARDRNWLRVSLGLPCWLLALIITIALAPIVAVMGWFGAGALGVAALPLTLYMVRDLTLLHVFAYADNPARTEATTLVYLALLYAVIPSFMALIRIDAIAALIRPAPFANPLFASLVLSVQIAALSSIAYRRWRNRVVAVN